jgi:micrococcal nuclease
MLSFLKQIAFCCSSLTTHRLSHAICRLSFPNRLPSALCFLLPLLILLTACQPSPLSPGELVRVSRVVSGQTLEVVSLTGTAAATEKVRLVGVNAPAWNQEPWYGDAQKRLESLIGSDRIVLLEADEEKSVETKDGSKFRLAYIWKDKTLLNEQLVAEGYVLAATRSPNLKYDQRLTRAQEQARLSGLGLWNPDHPMRQTPQEFRQQNQRN